MVGYIILANDLRDMDDIYYNNTMLMAISCSSSRHLFLQSSTHNKLLHSYNRQRGSNSSISIQIPWYASIFVRQWILVVDIRRQTILLPSPNTFEIFRDKWTTITWCSLHVSFDIYPGISYSIRLLLLEISDSISTILTYIRRMQKDIVGFALVQLELAVYTSRRSRIY